MKKNNFFKYGKIFLSSVLVSIYSSVGIVSYGGKFQIGDQTTMNLSVTNNTKSLENKILSIENHKDNIKNNLKIHSTNKVEMKPIKEESGTTFSPVKKVKSLSQKIFKVAKYLASSAICGIGYIIKNKFFQRKAQKKYEEVDPQKQEIQKKRPIYVSSMTNNHSSFMSHNLDDDDDDDSKPPKFFPTKPTETKDSMFTNDETETPNNEEGEEKKVAKDEDAAPPVSK